jgi:hypothetical protein
VPVGSYHLKLPVIAFALALVASLVGDPRPGRIRAATRLNLALVALLAVYTTAGLVGIDHAASFGQLATVVLGAVVPYLAISRVLRTFPFGLSRALTAFISGAVLAAIFGLYQLASTLGHVPYPLEYSGLGNGFQRIASFSYEPAYFAQWLILALAAVGARAWLLKEPVSRKLTGLLVVVLLLANSRAVVLMIPVFLILAASRTERYARKAAGTLLVLLVFVVPIVALTSPSTFGNIAARVGSIGDPREVTSNAPRLKGYNADIAITSDHPVLGVGPGNLFIVGDSYGLDYGLGVSSNTAVANDVWLQAMVDGGYLLLAAQIGFFLVAALSLARAGTRQLMAGWLTVLLIEGALTSNFYDVKLWAVLGLGIGMAELRRVAVLDHDAATFAV